MFFGEIINTLLQLRLTSDSITAMILQDGEKKEIGGVSERLDRAGAMASLLCAIHCAVMPLIVTLLPLLGLGFLADERVEWGLLLLSAALGTTSLCLGYRQHRSQRALQILGVALALLVCGRIIESQHLGILGVFLVVCGGLGVATAHIVNRRLCHTCIKCHPA